MSKDTPEFELAGVGSPIVDLVAQVPESFLANVSGEKGGMVLVDDAEMGRIVARLGTPPSLSTGGSAANATYNGSRLGLRTTFIGKLGNDRLAEAYVERFGAAGVDVSRFKRGSVANARCLALVTPDAQRTMRTNLGAAMTLSPSEISAGDFRGVGHAHIEGYLVFNRDLCDAVLNAARAAGCTISLDLSSFEVVNASRDWMFRQFGNGIDIVFANEDEIRALFPGDKATTRLSREGLPPTMSSPRSRWGATARGSRGAPMPTGSRRSTCPMSSTRTAPATHGRRASSMATSGEGPWTSAARSRPSWDRRPSATWAR